MSLDFSALIKALEAGGYNAAPTELTQGSGHWHVDYIYVCECGAEKCKSNIHSDWCPKCVK